MRKANVKMLGNVKYFRLVGRFFLNILVSAKYMYTKKLRLYFKILMGDKPFALNEK